MKGTENAYEGENRSLHMKERIGYGVGDFANNMMYTPVNSFFTYFLTNVAGLGAGVVGTILLISRLQDGVSDLIVGSLMAMQFFTLQQSSKVLETQLFPVLCTECLLTQLSTTTGNPASAQRALFSAQTPSDRKSVPVSAPQFLAGYLQHLVS